MIGVVVLVAAVRAAWVKGENSGFGAPTELEATIPRAAELADTSPDHQATFQSGISFSPQLSQKEAPSWTSKLHLGQLKSSKPPQALQKLAWSRLGS